MMTLLKKSTETISIDPKKYYDAVYNFTGTYIQEDKFDKNAGITRLSGYEFTVVNENKWKQVKDRYNF